QSVIEDVNPEMLRLTRYTREELLGRQSSFLWRDEPDSDREERYRRTAAAGSWHDDRNLYDRDGRAIPVAFSGSPLHDAAGNLIGFVGVTRDMSERNRLLDDLARAKAT